MNRLLLFTILMFSSVSVLASTIVEGNITASQTWTPAGSPYLIKKDANLTIKSGAVLTIMPGVTVSLESVYPMVSSIFVEGSLRILGKKDSQVKVSYIPIIFKDGAVDYDTSSGDGALLQYGIFNGAPVLFIKTSFWVENCHFMRQGDPLGLGSATGVFVNDGNGVNGTIRNSYFPFGWNPSFKIVSPMKELNLIEDTFFVYKNEPIKSAEKNTISKCLFSGEIESHYMEYGFFLELGAWTSKVEVSCSRFYGLRNIFMGSISDSNSARIIFNNCAFDSCMNLFEDSKLRNDTVSIHMSNFEDCYLFTPNYVESVSQNSLIDLSGNYWNITDTAQIMISFFNQQLNSWKSIKLFPYLNNTPPSCGPSVVYNSRKKFEKYELNIFPNPAQDRLYIRALPKGTFRIVIYDLQGKIICYWPCNAENMELNLSEISAGIYYLSAIQSDGSKITSQLMIQ